MLPDTPDKSGEIWLRSGEIFQLFLNKHVQISTKVLEYLVSCKNFRNVCIHTTQSPTPTEQNITTKSKQRDH